MGRIIIHVVPGASSKSLEFTSDARAGRSILANAPSLKVRLPAKPEEGRANRALIEWLTELSGHPVQIVRGTKGRNKTVAFSSSEDEFLAALKEGWETSAASKKRD